jgi:peptidoglycan/LPS O-acetylase OafA/YrhL
LPPHFSKDVSIARSNSPHVVEAPTVRRKVANVHATAHTTRVPSLDGLRGLAIAGVVAFHADALRGGFLGVDLFFVLSGYLITGLLAKEQREHGRIALREFWTRRARRLVPAVLLLLIAVQAWVRIEGLPGMRPTVNEQSLAALVYGSNWYNVFAEVGYWDVGVERSPLNHLWSLAIEEQFYVVFPLLMVLLVVLLARRADASRARAMTVTVLCMALVALAITPALFAAYGADRSYFGTDSRSGALLLGAALALWMAEPRQRELASAESSAGRRRVSNVLAVGGAIVLVVTWLIADTKVAWLYQGGLALHGIAGTAMVASLALHPNGPAPRVLSWRPLVWLGERSYSLYLWHWPVMVILTPERTGMAGFSLFALTAAVIAAGTLFSYHVIEHPIRYSSLAGWRLVGSMTVPATVVGVSAYWFQPPPPPQFGTSTITTEGRGGLRLLIAGDSWARSLGIGMANVDSARRHTIVNLGKGGCGIADAVRERVAESGDRATPPQCAVWRTSWAESMRSFRPDAAILTVGNWDQVPKDVDGSGVFVRACDAPFKASYSRQLDTAITILSANETPVFVTTVYDNDGQPQSSPDCMNAMLREAVARHAARGVRLLDLYAQLCQNHQCPSTVLGRAIYTETNHLADEAERRIGLWILNSVSASLPAATARER